MNTPNAVCRPTYRSAIESIRNILGALTLLSAPCVAVATELIVEENFSNYTAGSLLGQAAMSEGLEGTWGQRFSGLAQTYSVGTVGLAYGSLVTSGGVLKIGQSDTSIGCVVLPLQGPALSAINPPPGSSTTVWMSFLVKQPSTPGGTLRVGLIRDTTTTGPLWGSAVVARAPSGFGSQISSNQSTGGSVAASITCFYLSKIELHNYGNGQSWTDGTVTTWQFTNGVLPSGAPLTGGISAALTGNTADRRLQALAVQPGNSSGGYAIDEIRMATSFDGVVPRLVAYETFNNYSFGSIIGQNAMAFGGDGAWSKRFSGLPQEYLMTSSSLAYGGELSEGGSLHFGNSQTGVGAAVMDLSSEARDILNPAAGTSKTLWLSFLLRTPASLGGTLQIGFGRSVEGSAPLWGSAAIARSPSGFGSRLNTVASSGGTVLGGKTHFFLSKITLNNTGSGTFWTSGNMTTWKYENDILPAFPPAFGGVTTNVTANNSNRRLEALILQPGTSTGEYILDDLQLGTSFGSVIPGGVLQAGGSTLRYPDDCGIIDITKAPYHAVGDGITDNTNAIRRAITDNVSKSRFIYFPKGTYLVSEPLEWKRYQAFGGNGDWGCNLGFIGEDRDGTVIRLMDNATTFGNPASPKAVIFTANDGLDRAYFPWTEQGAGNDAFRNHIRNLTIDTGNGNPGAIAIDYHGHNYSSIEGVTIQSGDGAGVAGLVITRPTPGPLLVRNVEIIGFDHGVDVADWGYSLTFEHLYLSDQNVAGFRNNANVVTIRGLVSRNAVPAVVDTAAGSLITIVDSYLERDTNSASQTAISYAGDIFARNISVTGYPEVIRKGAASVAGPYLSEAHSRPLATVHGGPSQSLNLEVEETPTFHDNVMENWVDVRDFGAIPNDNTSDYQAIQNAIDASIANPNLTTLVFGRGADGNSFYETHRPIMIRGNIRKIVGMNATLHPRGSSYYQAGDLFNNPVLDFSEANHGPFIIEDMAIRSNSNRAISVEHNSAITLVCKSSQLNYRSVPGAGKVFFQDVTGGHYFFHAPGQKVFARQLNAEGTVLEKIDNIGAHVWILGLKTERTDGQSIIRNSGGGKLEILGALHYPLNNIAPGLPMVKNEESFLSMNFRTAHWTAGTRYENQVQDTQNGATLSFERNSIYDRSGVGPGGSIVTLYTSEP